MSSSAWRPSKGEYGPFGSAAGSQARIGKNIGFDTGGGYEDWKGDREDKEDAIRGNLVDVDSNILYEGDYLTRSQRSAERPIQDTYDAAVRQFEDAGIAAESDQEKYGDFSAQNFEDLTDEEKGSLFDEAGNILDTAELTRERSIADLEARRGSIVGEGIAQEQQAQQARMDTGLEYSGILEQNIEAGMGGLEAEIGDTQMDELGVIDTFQTALSDYDRDIGLIEEEWTKAKNRWEDAQGIMDEAQESYDIGIDDVRAEARADYYRDFQGGDSLENMKDRYIDFWTLGGDQGGGRSAAEGVFNVRGGNPGDFEFGSSYTQYTGGTYDDSGMFTTKVAQSGNLASGYGGHSELYDKIVERFASFDSQLGSGYYNEGDE
tara:strand:+ start:401 stop:1531 length:1131 start_codon:yes stop_codon:yes gene_type:complete